MIFRRISTGLVLLALTCVPGCGDSEPGTTVSGKVTYKGTPVPMGVINFFPATGGRPIGSSLGSDGEYEVKVPAGDYTVAVLTSTPPVPAGWKEGDPVPEPPVKVPERYRLPTNSPLKLTVPDEKSLVHDFPLE